MTSWRIWWNRDVARTVEVPQLIEADEYKSEVVGNGMLVNFYIGDEIKYTLYQIPEAITCDNLITTT